MAKKEVYIAGIGPLVYDDTVNSRGIVVTGKMKVQEAPSDPDDVARYSDIGGVAAPEDAPFVMADNSKMTSQARILAAGNGIDLADAGAGGNLIVSAKETEIDHDLLKNFVPNEHIDWTNTSATLNTTGDVKSTNQEVADTGAVYIGDRNTDGSWRITRSGNDLVFQRRESGVWNTKLTVLATGGTSP